MPTFLCSMYAVCAAVGFLLSSSQHAAGWQVGAHGTGAAIPPVDETVVALTLVTPGQASRPARASWYCRHAITLYILV